MTEAGGREGNVGRGGRDSGAVGVRVVENFAFTAPWLLPVVPLFLRLPRPLTRPLFAP